MKLVNWNKIKILLSIFVFFNYEIILNCSTYLVYWVNKINVLGHLMVTELRKDSNFLTYIYIYIHFFLYI